MRWGNGAANQRQHDVYGVILDCADQWLRSGREVQPALWADRAGLADTAEQAWRQPDQGIWEVRRDGRVFTYSAGLCQVALDRAASIGERLGLPGPTSAWRASADRLRRRILEESWDEDAQTLGAHLDGGGALDASLLALPLRHVVPADHPRMAASQRHRLHRPLRHHRGCTNTSHRSPLTDLGSSSFSDQRQAQTLSH